MKWNSNGGEITAKNLIAFFSVFCEKCSPTVRKKFKKEKSKTKTTKIFLSIRGIMIRKYLPWIEGDFQEMNIWNRELVMIVNWEDLLLYFDFS